MPIDGPHSIGVPGEVAAWEMYHQNFCTLPMDILLEDAVHYAQEGFPLSPGIGGSFTTNRDKLAKFPASAAIMQPGGRTLGPGDVLVNRDLARSLTRVAQGGAGEFYRGELAKEMVDALQESGGLFTLEDFAGHQAEMYQPIATTYAGHKVYQTQPPSQGFLMLEMLNLVEGFGLDKMKHNSAQAVHLMVEAKKIAYSDRNRLAGDPKIVEWPLDELISKEYGRRRSNEIDPNRAGSEYPSLQPVKAGGDTSYFCVADGEGNCVSWVHSLSQGFGSGFVAKGTGIVFNNRAGRGFSLEPGHPNVIAPGKRTMHTLNCYLALKDGKAAMVGGTPGGDLQPQAGMQVFTNMVDFGLDPQTAVEAPRWWSFPGTDPVSVETPMELRVEPGFPEESIEKLEALGHKVARRQPGVFDGKFQLIVIDPETGVLIGASDPRGDGHAAAV